MPSNLAGFLGGVLALVLLLPGFVLIAGLAMWPVVQFLRFIY